MYGNLFCGMFLEQGAGSHGLGNSTEGLNFFFFPLRLCSVQIDKKAFNFPSYFYLGSNWICIVHIYQLGLLSLLEVISWNALFDSLSASIVLKMTTFSSDIWLVPKTLAYFGYIGPPTAKNTLSVLGRQTKMGAFINPKYARVHLQIY